MAWFAFNAEIHVEVQEVAGKHSPRMIRLFDRRRTVLLEPSLRLQRNWYPSILEAADAAVRELKAERPEFPIRTRREPIGSLTRKRRAL